MHGIQALTTIPDPRCRHERRYPLVSLLAIVLRTAMHPPTLPQARVEREIRRQMVNRCHSTTRTGRAVGMMIIIRSHAPEDGMTPTPTQRRLQQQIQPRVPRPDPSGRGCPRGGAHLPRRRPGVPVVRQDRRSDLPNRRPAERHPPEPPLSSV